MVKATTRGQALEVVGRVGTQVDWDKIDSAKLQEKVINLSPEEFGRRFTDFLLNDAQMIINQPGILSINRTIPFDPIAFLGEGWLIWKGPADGNGLTGEEEQDKRSLALTSLDLAKVRFEDCLKKGETSIKGEEKLRRLIKKGDIRLDAQVFWALWQNQHLIPESWKEKINGNTRYIFFEGTTLRRPNGYRFVLYLYWRGGAWHWFVYWLGRDWHANDPSAVLAE